MTPLPPKPWSGRGRPPKLIRRSADHKPVSARDLAKVLPAQAWQTVTWREGTKTSLTSRFAAVRVRPGHRDYWRAQPWPEEWLLMEWPEGEKEPTKYWLSTPGLFGSGHERSVRARFAAARPSARLGR